MKVKDMMSRDVIAVSPDTAIKEVFHLMVKHRITGLPVVDREKNLLGFIPESNLLGRGIKVLGKKEKERHIWGDYRSFVDEQRRLYGKMAKDVMNDKVVTLSEEEDIMDVIELMLEKNLSRFPVVRRGKLVGFLSRKDIMKTIMEMEEEESKRAPKEFSDQEITEQIVGAIKKHHQIQIIDMFVKTTKGHVRLTGRVGSFDDLQACDAIARSIPGVREVYNDLVMDALLK